MKVVIVNGQNHKGSTYHTAALRLVNRKGGNSVDSDY